ncbi:MAG: iron-sulfur cluster-binding protein [Candidatus Eisenbacteria bacterium]|nr:iron-sulfur cluster-binding protein [Candidatus Eisenbacteria bacterium]
MLRIRRDLLLELSADQPCHGGREGALHPRHRSRLVDHRRRRLRHEYHRICPPGGDPDPHDAHGRVARCGSAGGGRVSRTSFIARAEAAGADPDLVEKIFSATDRQFRAREEITREIDDLEDLRALAAGVRDEVLDRWDAYLEFFAERAAANGVEVHWAADAAEARAQVAGIAHRHGARRIIKSKSMVTEEIGLNPALEAEGCEVVETDLGEFILQAAGQRPSHIVAPAIHLTTSEITAVFREAIGYEGPGDPSSLTRAAREHLREKFREAEMGVSGVNIAMAEEGAWAVATNEGNGRFVTSLPPVTTAVMGIERLVRDMTGAAVILKLLARSATGQRITQYTSIMSGPGGSDTPRHVHLVLVDNGRSAIRATPYAAMLRCIRCGACLNACPVFRRMGGHSFPGCYSGPMGSVLQPLLLGLEQAGDTCKACSLCHLCAEVCPVKIPLPDYLLALREDLVTQGHAPHAERWSMRAAGWVLSRPRLYRLAQKALRLGSGLRSREGWMRRLPGAAGGWTQTKDFPRPAPRSYLSGKDRG